ncbi:MAG: AMP-binding protein [Bacteroidales bacterium]
MQNIEFSTLKELFELTTERFANNLSFGFVSGQSYSYRTLKEEADKIGKMLVESGAKPGDKIAIMAQNMPNWPVAYFAIICNGMVVVPLLPDFSQFEVENILEHSESNMLFVSKSLSYKIGERVKERLELVVELDSWKKLHLKGGLSVGAKAVPKEEDLATIIYTSGTTGGSKGVMLTHSNLVSHLYSAMKLRPGFEWDIWLSLLPLSHTFENSLGMLLPMASGSSVYYIEKPPTPTVLLAALKEVRPTTLLSVPLIIEKIFRGSVLPKFKKSKVVASIYSTTLGRKLLHRVAGKELMKTFGGRVRFFGIGGAKLDGEVEQFLYEAKFPYAIGYGLTESSPLLAGATPKFVKWQSSGTAVDGVELRIDNPNPITGEGEIVARGPNITAGYYKNPEATKEAFTKDGWFRTKDLGLFDKKGRLYIKGRLTNMILGPGGENIYPEEIEMVINGHSMVAESVVTESKGKLVAKVHFNPEKLKALKEATTEAIASYYDETKEKLVKSYEDKRGDLIHFYDEKREEMTSLFNNKVEQLKLEVQEYVNKRVNKFSRIAVVIEHREQFEKTATQKIKRYKYTD